MATIKAIFTSEDTLFNADRSDYLGLALSAALPIAVFIIVHGLANIAGVQPMFFAPFVTPGWMGATLHVASLALFGISRWMVSGKGLAGRSAGRWLIGLMAAMILTPFATMQFDTFGLAIMSFALFTLGLAAFVRVGQVDGRAALVMTPAMAWMALAAFVSLSFGAAWAPPFAVTNSQPAA